MKKAFTIIGFMLVAMTTSAQMSSSMSFYRPAATIDSIYMRSGVDECDHYTDGTIVYREQMFDENDRYIKTVVRVEQPWFWVYYKKVSRRAYPNPQPIKKLAEMRESTIIKENCFQDN